MAFFNSCQGAVVARVFFFCTLSGKQKNSTEWLGEVQNLAIFVVTTHRLFVPYKKTRVRQHGGSNKKESAEEHEK
jgi:hypothetical protein